MKRNPGIADQVKEKQRANFCGYFRIRPNAYQARDNTAPLATTRTQLDVLFGNLISTQEARSEADVAREQLEKLFGSENENINEEK